MAKIAVPPSVRSAVVDRVESAIAEVVEEYKQQLSVALATSPWSELTEGERARWLLLREVQKAIQQMRLRQDGARARLRRDATGKPCPRSGVIMSSPAEIELEHEEYDGRPPVPVHRDWHRKAQSH